MRSGSNNSVCSSKTKTIMSSISSPFDWPLKSSMCEKNVRSNSPKEGSFFVLILQIRKHLQQKSIVKPWRRHSLQISATLKKAFIIVEKYKNGGEKRIVHLIRVPVELAKMVANCDWGSVDCSKLRKISTAQKPPIKCTKMRGVKGESFFGVTIFKINKSYSALISVNG